MGGANNICSDKTGTLTMNKMTLTQIWNVETKIIDHTKEELKESDTFRSENFNELFKIASLVNSTALLKPEEKGSSTEIAVLKYFQKMNIDYEEYREKYDIKVKFPFSSKRKRMSIIVNYEDNAHLFIKGASELVLSSCNQWYNSRTEEIEPITSEL